jgi:hypothetical protein
MLISPFQEYAPTDWSGLTTETHLASIYQLDVQMASDLITLIHQTNYGMDLDSFLGQFGTKTFNSDEDFRWMLQGQSRRNLPLKRAEINGTAVSATSEAGKNGATFTLVFPEALFSETDLIVGEKNERYPIRVLSGPTFVGDEVHYECDLFTGDPFLFIPYEELIQNKRFSKEWNPVETTLSVKGGTVNYTSPFAMRNTFTFIRMEDTRPGNMIDKPVAFSWIVVDENNVKSTKTTWMQYADWEFETQFKESKSLALMFATSNRREDGTYSQKGLSGNYIRQGAGIRQQMETSNVAYYNEFDIEWATEILLDTSINRLSKDNRKFIWRTGEWGMYQFSKSLEDYASLYTPLFDNTRVVAGAGNSMKFKGQFLEYMGPNGIEMTLSHEPMNDNTVRNKVYHPDGGLAESRRYDILDVGTSNGQANIQKCYVKGQENIMGYIPGLRHPFKLGKESYNSIMAHSVDGYSIHRACAFGAMVTDPTRTLGMIPSILSEVGVVY